MKVSSIILHLAVVSMLLSACSPSVPENEFHIEGRIGGLADSTVIGLTKWEGTLGRGIAKDTIIGGRFSFVVPMTETTRLSIAGTYGDDSFPNTLRFIYAEPGEKITITGTGKLFGTWKIKSRIPEQREDDAYIMQTLDDHIRSQQLSIERTKARAEGNYQALDSLRTIEKEINMSKFRGDIAVMDRTPVSDIWLDNLRGVATMVEVYEEYDVLREDVTRLYERLTPEQRELPTAQDIKQSLFPPEQVEVGDDMADATLKALDGSMHTFSDYLGKYLILDFWASGCGPCIMSMPELKALGEKYPETLKVIGINIDSTEEGWRMGTEMFKPSYLNLYAPPSSDIDERYGVNGIPHVAVISPEGKIVETWVGYGEGRFEQKLAPYLEAH